MVSTLSIVHRTTLWYFFNSFWVDRAGQAAIVGSLTNKENTMFRHLKTKEVALLLHGLRQVYVEDSVDEHERLTKLLETELASRGARLAEPGQTVAA